VVGELLEHALDAFKRERERAGRAKERWLRAGTLYARVGMQGGMYPSERHVMQIHLPGPRAIRNGHRVAAIGNRTYTDTNERYSLGRHSA
jgi:hypothetical protein